METSDACVLSSYRELTVINPEHGVSLVQHTETDRIYARKTLDVYNADVYRYLRRHPVMGIPEIVEIVEHDGHLTVIEEYISGQTLREILDNGNLFSVEEAVGLIEELCDILRELHGADPPIIHRDIKPSNIIITPNGSLRLLDMDAARQVRGSKSEDTALIGTVGYAAPEQYGFGTSNVQTDIYSVGVLLCELVTGALPKEKMPEGRLGRVIRKCTQIDPKNRYRDIYELQKALNALHSSFTNSRSRRTGKRSYALPGFRTGKPTNMMIALFAYVSLLWLSLTYTAEGISPGIVLWTLRGIYLVSGFFILLFTGNYLDIWSVLRIDRIPNAWIRTILLFAIDFVLVMAMLILMIIVAVSMGVRA